MIKNEDGGFGESDEASNNGSEEVMSTFIVELNPKDTVKVSLHQLIGKAKARWGILELFQMA